MAGCPSREERGEFSAWSSRGLGGAYVPFFLSDKYNGVDIPQSGADSSPAFKMTPCAMGACWDFRGIGEDSSSGEESPCVFFQERRSQEGRCLHGELVHLTLKSFTKRANKIYGYLLDPLLHMEAFPQFKLHGRSAASLEQKKHALRLLQNLLLRTTKHGG